MPAPLPRVLPHGGRHLCLHFSPGGQHLLAHSHGRGAPAPARLWSTETGEPSEHLQLPLHGAAFSPDGTRLYTAAEGALLEIREVDGPGLERVRLPEAMLERQGISWGEPVCSADGQWVAITARQLQRTGVLMFEPRSPRAEGRWLVQPQAGPRFSDLFLLPGEVQALHPYLAGMFHLWRFPTASDKDNWHLTLEAGPVFFSGNGTQLIHSTSQGQVRLLGSGGNLQHPGRLLPGPYLELWKATFSAECRFLVAVGHRIVEEERAPVLVIWDLSGDTPPAMLGLPGDPRDLDLAPGGSLLATVSEQPERGGQTQLCIWSLTSGRLLRRLEAADLPALPGLSLLQGPSRRLEAPTLLETARFSPDGRWLAATAPPQVLLWEVAELLG